MNRRLLAAMPEIAAGILTLGFAWACAMFAWQPTLATFADDSVSYLVMAQVFSPWQAASPAVATAFSREAFYPPLFPLLLALAGAAHHVAWAHALTALLVAAAIPLLYVLGARWLEDRRAAAVVALCVVLLPSMWINAKGILSEPLFAVLLMATFHAIGATERRGGRGIWVVGVLMAAMALTRTAALPMIAVYGLWAATRGGTPAASRARAAAPALAAFAAYAIWVLLRPATTDNYARIVVEQAAAILGAQSPLAAIATSLLRQANAVAEGWLGSLMLFWVQGQPVRVVLAGAVGCLALAGMLLRIASGKADGWMIAGYLAVFLVWPFYDQMGRFLFPVMPVLVLYAFLAAAATLRAMGRRPALAHGLLVAVLLSLTLPALAFISQRAQAPGRFAEIVDWYRIPGLDQARARARVHLDLFADMDAIRKLTRPDDRIMWVAPSYIALLADRRGIAAPEPGLAPAAYRQAVRDSGADYVFLTVYHPRDTLRNIAWQAGTGALAGNAKIVHLRTQGEGGVVTAMLLKADGR